MRKISFGWMLLCILCLILTGFLCIWKNGEVLFAKIGEKPEDTATAFFRLLREGNSAQAEELLISSYPVSLQTEELSEEARLLLNALRGSYECSLSGTGRQRGDTANLTVLLTRLDVTAANKAATAAAKSGMTYINALQSVLADCSSYLTSDILTVNCRIEDGVWKIIPDEAFLTALRGGLNG